jgi:DNA-binding NarL/FixJ family response regulator
MPLNDVRVLIVAESPLARAGLASMLANEAGLMIVGQAAPDADLNSALAAYLPDVLVWDLGWDITTGLELLADIREASPPALALLNDVENAGQALAQGARAVLLQDVRADTLAAALVAISRGLVVLLPDMLPSTALAVSEPSLPADALTPRELEVLTLVAEGLANKAIAVRLGISDHTVKFHINAVMSKLGAQSRTEAVVRATRLGLIVL